VSSSFRKAIAGGAIAATTLGALAIFTALYTKSIEQAYPPSGRFVDVDGGRLHVVELGRPDAPAVVLLHGASANLGDMRLALGDSLAANYRVILLDRPGHGWSDRPNGAADASPARQARLIHQALDRIGLARPIFIAHSWAGAVAATYALEYPADVGALVLLAPVTHPWPKSAAWYNSVVVALLAENARGVTAPVIGPLLAHTLALPIGTLLMGLGVDSVFAPQAAPPDYLAKVAGALMLRPSAFIANAQDLKTIQEFLEIQAPRYGSIRTPTVIVTGDDDAALPYEIHAKAMAAAVPGAKLIVVPGVGHMVHYAAPERIAAVVAELLQASPGEKPANSAQKASP
jgi:pimeloyl-ACP methyl ester carboxylesterase